MTISTIKKELHEYIDAADDKKLKAIHLLLENELHNQRYSESDLKKFYDVLEGYESGTVKVSSVEVAHRKIRAKIATK